jgi:4-hydroxy-2-oxoheptanedioate aldolase
MTQNKLQIAAIAVLAALAVLFESSTHAVAQQKKSRLNPVIEKLEKGASVITPTDWAFIDMEHSPYLIDKFVRTLDEMGKSRKPNGQWSALPVIRIPMDGEHDSHFMVKQVLDQGAFAIIFPRIENRAQALRAVRSMRYPPQRGGAYPEPAGKRGYGPVNAAKYWGMTLPEYLERADVWPLNPKGELLAFMLIESVDGVKNIEEIITTPGVGGIFLGHSDLGMSLGVGPAKANSLQPEIEQAVQTVLKACKAHKVACGYAAIDEADIKQRREQGFQLIMDMKKPE